MRSPGIALLVLATSSVSVAAESGRRIDILEALQIADTRQPGVLAARARLLAAEAAAHAQRGRLLPSLHVSDSQNWYHSSVSISPALLMGANPSSLQGFPNQLSANVMSVAVAQPLLGLLHLGEDFAAAENNADASAETLKASQAELHARVKTYFLRLFEARALADTASASQHDLEEQVVVTEHKMAVGAAMTADVLRLKVAAANAHQQAIAAHAQEESIRAALTEMLGVSDDPDVDFVEPADLLQQAPPMALKDAKAAALAHRPELAARRLQATAALQRAHARGWALLPEVNVVASYMHIKASPFGSKLSGSLDVGASSAGIAASWPLWEWGASWYEYDRADAEADAAALEAQEAAEQVASEVAARRADTNAALSAVEVAQVQVASAEEAYRVMQATASAGSATITDLLDAEAALTGARLSLVRARYEAAVAAVAFQRAVGGP